MAFDTKQLRKHFLLESKPDLRQHSAMSVVKRKLARVQSGSTPCDKVIYAEKYLIEAVDRYIQAKAEAAQYWTEYMEKETNIAIKDFYLNLCKLDSIWVSMHQRYRLLLPDQRNLFKRLMNGEKEIEKLRKESQSTASKVVKLTTQLDDFVKRFRSGKPIDIEALRAKETDVHQALKSNRKAQKQYEMALQNHKRYKYNEVKKVMKNLFEMEIELYQDCRKLSETKLQLQQLYLSDSYNKLEMMKTVRASEKSQELIDALYKELDISCQDSLLPEIALYQRRANHPNQNRSLPSASPLETLGKAASQDFDGDAFYKPIDDAESDDDTESVDYIYQTTEDLQSDNDDTDYEYVTPDLVRDKDKVVDVTSKYFPLIETPDAAEESSYYVDPGVTQPAAIESQPDEEIFGSISSLHLQTRASGAKRTPESVDSGYYSARSRESSSSEGNEKRSQSSSGTPAPAVQVKYLTEQLEKDVPPPLPEKKNKKRGT